MRLDQFVKQQEQISRHKAQELISAGHVEVNGVPQNKAAFQVAEKDVVKIKNYDLLQYVSRGGLKLEHAIKDLQIQVADKVCFDIGQSTGGFSDCLLQKGARQIFGLDVGKEQLAAKIKDNSRVIAVQQLNIKDFDLNALKTALDNKYPDLIVSDLSFISTLALLPKIATFFGSHTEAILLIKPQFELGAKQVSKQGIVKDKNRYFDLEKEVEKSCQQAGLLVLDYIHAKPKGRDGNQEFILYCKKT